MKKFALSLFVLISVIFLVACQGDDEKIPVSGEASDGVQEMKIKFAHVVAENTPKHKGALKMKEYIEKESGGKIEVEIYPNSSLFGDQDEYQNLVANNIQFIAPDLTKFVGNNPQFNVPALPFMFDDDDEAIAFWDGEKGKEVLASLKNDGVIGLSMWPNGGKHLTNGKRSISSPEDLKGLKFRTQGGQVLESIYHALGAGSESIPFGELYTALDQGVVDGQENTFSNIESKKFDEVQKYMTVMNHTRVDYAVFTNTKFWDSMNEATKKIVEDGLAAGTEVARAEAKSLNEKALETIKERGNVEIVELTPEQVEEFRKVLEPIYKEYEEEIGADVIEAAREAAK
ncbi:DctP family TRAP transporter solute-binding subunit [Psychrobacillus sp. FSL W7-1457]|uniref:DctP family TRAP transporter solute-binding subunit n=1 Tax=Psychrobacillus sp. FSL W7-1457 TaxID=2954547 RepID=UPI00315B1F4E